MIHNDLKVDYQPNINQTIFDVNPTINVPSGDGVGNQCNYDDFVDGLLVFGFTEFMISAITNPHGP